MRRAAIADGFSSAGAVLPIPLEILLVTALGLVLGSFATALVYRAGRGIPWWSRGDRSSCPRCGHTLSPKDLFPLFSWIFLRGRCRYCRARISPVYPLTELAMAMLCLGYYWLYGLSAPVVFPIFLVLPFLWALAAVDFRSKILPDTLVLAVAVLGGVRLLLRMAGEGEVFGPFLEAASGALIFGGVAWLVGKAVGRLTGKASLGFGDVKFFAVAGWWLGPASLAAFCVAAGLAGIVLGLAWRKVTGEERFPFGPALILSFCLLLALESPLLGL